MKEERQQVLDDFIEKIEKLKRHSFYQVQEVIPYGYTLNSSKSKTLKTLTLVGLTHGNETVGIQVLSSFIDFLLTTEVSLPCSLNIILGNVEAYLQGVRFIEKDLNRCFHYDSFSREDLLEEKRGQEMEQLLSQTDFLLDFHQTQVPTDRAFFVLNYKKESFQFGKKIDPNLAMLYFPKGLERRVNLTTTIFVSHYGGAALTIELGERGFNTTQKNSGLGFILQSLTIIGEGKLDVREGSVFEVKHQIPFPGGPGDLLPHIKNFYKVTQDEEIGTFEGKALLSPDDGYLIFPKFQTGPNRVKTQAGDPLCLLVQSKHLKC